MFLPSIRLGRIPLQRTAVLRGHCVRCRVDHRAPVAGQLVVVCSGEFVVIIQIVVVVFVIIGNNPVFIFEV